MENKIRKRRKRLPRIYMINKLKKANSELQFSDSVPTKIIRGMYYHGLAIERFRKKHGYVGADAQTGLIQ
jgi:hypothetical protein